MEVRSVNMKRLFAFIHFRHFYYQASFFSYVMLVSDRLHCTDGMYVNPHARRGRPCVIAVSFLYPYLSCIAGHKQRPVYEVQLTPPSEVRRAKASISQARTSAAELIHGRTFKGHPLSLFFFCLA